MKLPNITLDPKSATMRSEPYGDVWIYFDGTTDMCQSMVAGSVRLKPGASPHPPHQHPDEEFMLVTEGTGEILVNGQTTKVGPGSMMYCAGNELHGVENTGDTPMQFYFYKWIV